METISVYFAVDNVMAVPLAVTIESILASKAPDTHLDLHVLSCGIWGTSKAAISKMVGKRADITFHELGRDIYRRLDALWLGTARAVPPAVFARLVAGSVLPARVRRAIYLDVDIVVRRDLQPLWKEADAGAPIVAVIDLPNDRRSASILENLSVTDRDAYDLRADTPYFSAGVLVLDIEVQRAGAETAIIEIMRRNPNLKFADQDALNAYFAGRVSLTDPRWNQMEAAYWDLAPERQPHDAEAIEQIRDDPHLIHYTGRPKPWMRGCTHPRLAEWNTAFARTPWAKSFRMPAREAATYVQRAARVGRRRLQRLVWSS